VLVFPLPVCHVREVVAAAEKAGFGRGADTIVDTNVRDAWKVKADQLSFLNPAFTTAVQKLAATQVANGLGVPGAVRAELYNLLVYEKGGKFTKHRDSEKEPGMFGTLVIVLPSVHTGGDLVVQHAEKEQRISCSGSARDKLLLPTWVAFYLSVEGNWGIGEGEESVT
jgi:hypothetical protein